MFNLANSGIFDSLELEPMKANGESGWTQCAWEEDDRTAKTLVADIES